MPKALILESFFRVMLILASLLQNNLPVKVKVFMIIWLLKLNVLE